MQVQYRESCLNRGRLLFSVSELLFGFNARSVLQSLAPNGQQPCIKHRRHIEQAILAGIYTVD